MAVRRFNALPGFGLSMGITMFFLSGIVLLPLGGLVLRTMGISWHDFWQLATTDRALAAYRLTFLASLAAAVANAAFGTLLAWVLVRYDFPGRRFLDAMVDFPFALPTAVAGLTLANLFAANGWLGKYLVPLGIKGAFTPLGVVIALTFVGLPFVVRTLQPVLAEPGTGSRRGRGDTRGRAPPHLLNCHRAFADAHGPHWFCASFRARRRRIRLDCLHLRQSAVQDRNCALPHRHAAGRIRLHGRNRAGRGAAGVLLPAAGGDQPARTLVEPVPDTEMRHKSAGQQKNRR